MSNQNQTNELTEVDKYHTGDQCPDCGVYGLEKRISKNGFPYYLWLGDGFYHKRKDAECNAIKSGEFGPAPYKPIVDQHIGDNPVTEGYKVQDNTKKQYPPKFEEKRPSVETKHLEEERKLLEDTNILRQVVEGYERLERKIDDLSILMQLLLGKLSEQQKDKEPEFKTVTPAKKKPKTKLELQKIEKNTKFVDESKDNPYAFTPHEDLIDDSDLDGVMDSEELENEGVINDDE